MDSNERVSVLLFPKGMMAVQILEIKLDKKEISPLSRLADSGRDNLPFLG